MYDERVSEPPGQRPQCEKSDNERSAAHGESAENEIHPDRIAVEKHEGDPDAEQGEGCDELQGFLFDSAQPADVIHERTDNLIADLAHPRVQTYCMYGHGQPTEVPPKS